MGSPNRLRSSTQGRTRDIRLWSAASILALLVAMLAVAPASAAACPSGFANGPYGTSVPYCADITSAPADGVSTISLYFIAPTPVVDQLNITISAGAFIGGTGVFAATSFPTAQVQLTTISMDSRLQLASSAAGAAVVTISYVDFGSSHVDSQTSFTLTAVPQMPSTKSDCMADGWRGLVDGDGHPFKNQGACITSLKGA